MNMDNSMRFLINSLENQMQKINDDQEFSKLTGLYVSKIYNEFENLGVESTFIEPFSLILMESITVTGDSLETKQKILRMIIDSNLIKETAVLINSIYNNIKSQHLGLNRDTTVQMVRNICLMFRS